MAEYAHEQAGALAECGVDVSLLCTPEFAPATAGAPYRVVPALQELSSPRSSRLRPVRALRAAGKVAANGAALVRAIRSSGADRVLFGAYSELLAPVWAPALRRLARGGVRFGVVVHDPVRERLAGPAWWHHWSVESAYSFVSEAFVHDESHLSIVAAGRPLHATVIPQGVYGRTSATRSRAQARAQAGVPADATLLLAFGSIRDNKNLDLAIQALAQVPGVHLLVAGDRIWSQDRPAEFYQELAARCGVADRCHWRIGFVPDDEVGNLFSAADLALLTYAGSFISASAVANTAARYRTPLLSSSGGGWLRDVTCDYGLGVWVPPDSVDAIVQGMRRWLDDPPEPQWERFAREHSWQRNAELVMERMWPEDGAGAPP